MRERLDYKSSRDAGVEYLRRQHERFLPEVTSLKPVGKAVRENGGGSGGLKETI